MSNRTVDTTVVTKPKKEKDTNFFLLHSFRWKKNVRKAARNCGKETTNYRGEKVPARKIGPHCSCPLECFERVITYFVCHIWLSCSIIAKPLNWITDELFSK